MAFHAVYASRRATPSRDTVVDVWGELARRYVKPELNAKSSKEEVWKGIVLLDKMGYLVVDSATNQQGTVITPADLPAIMAVIAKPRAAKKPRPPAAAAKPAASAKGAAAKPAKGGAPAKDAAPAKAASPKKK